MPRTVEQWLAAVRDAREPAELAKAIAVDRAGAGLVIAAAAKRVNEERIEALAPALADAFERLGDAKKDPGSRGKIAIARALHELDHWDDRVFVAGLRIAQLEGLGPEDTAAELRGICGIAHAHFARPDALDVLGELLADAWRTARVGAAQGLADAGRRDATALLRFKLLAGDPEPEVLAACCEALLALAPADSCEFCIRLLRAHDERAETAALALGSARLAAATDALVAWSEVCRPEQRHRVAYLALALLRCEPATAYLLDAIRTRSSADAIAAAKALATFKDDPALVERLRTAARGTPAEGVLA